MKQVKILSKQDAESTDILLLKQHNAITSGRYDFTSCQLDIMFMVLASLKDREMNYRIQASDIELITGRKWNISQLTTSTSQLLTRMFEVETTDHYRQFVLFQHFDYIKGTRTIAVKLSESALPFFFELKNNYTLFQLKSVLKCSSSYAKRLYMLACQWRTIGRFPRPISILELKKMLGLVDKKGTEQYCKISHFKDKVLDVAKKQINEHTDISFDYQLYKRGRSFEFIQIFVDTSKSNPQQFEIDFSQTIEHQKQVRSVTAYGLCQEHAELIVKDGYDNFLGLIEDINTKIKQRKLTIENPAAYIIGSYQKMGIIPYRES